MRLFFCIADWWEISFSKYLLIVSNIVLIIIKKIIIFLRYIFYYIIDHKMKETNPSRNRMKIMKKVIIMTRITIS